MRPPSSFVMTTGWPPSITATTEFVVPRSMPMIFPEAAIPKPLPARCARGAPAGPCRMAQSWGRQAPLSTVVEAERGTEPDAHLPALLDEQSLAAPGRRPRPAPGSPPRAGPGAARATPLRPVTQAPVTSAPFRSTRTVAGSTAPSGSKRARSSMPSTPTRCSGSGDCDLDHRAADGQPDAPGRSAPAARPRRRRAATALPHSWLLSAAPRGERPGGGRCHSRRCLAQPSAARGKGH